MKHEIILATCLALAQQAELELAETRAGVTDTGESQLSAERKLRQALARIAECEYAEGEQPNPSPLSHKLPRAHAGQALLTALGWIRVPGIENLATLELAFDHVEIPNTWYAFLHANPNEAAFQYWKHTWEPTRTATWLKRGESN